MKRSITAIYENFINQCRVKYGTRFTYDKVQYINNRTPVIITCPMHGDFTRKPTKLLEGNCYCSKCYTEKIRTDVINKFIDIVNDKYNNRFKYPYIYSEYKSVKTKITIACPDHGNFKQTCQAHRTCRDGGCPICAIKTIAKTQTCPFSVVLDKFIKKHSHLDGTPIYAYDESTYVNSHTPMRIICPVHGDFFQSPESHSSGQRCNLCSRENTRTSHDEFILKSNIAHNNKYSYDTCNYTIRRTKVLITCPIHGDFLQSPDAHLRGHGCRLCAQDDNGFTGYGSKYFKLNPNKKDEPGILYIIKMNSDTETFIKIGITRLSIKQRYKSTRSGGYNIDVKISCSMSIYNAYCMERKLLTKYKSHKYIPLNKEFGGYSECIEYSDAILNDIEKFINSH